MKWEHAKSESENGYCRLRIEVDWAELATDYDDIVSEYAKARIPGFRPGKVPRSVIEKRFQKEILEDLSRRSAHRIGLKAVQEAGAEALGPLEAFEIECDKGKPFRAQVRFLPMPEIRLPDLAGLLTSDDGTDPRDRISHRLLELVPFEVPGELVREELRRDGLGESDPGSEAWMEAADRIRLMLILKKIARQEGIEVDESDVETRIKEKASEFGTSVEELRSQLEKGGGRERLRNMLVAERTFEYLLENV
jgi:FKBP-type peptidyl-prolyl cis-trans isomerase (trigger factor)